MRADLSIRRIADDVFELEVETSSAAQSIAERLRNIPHVEDVVPGLECAAVRFAPIHAQDIVAAIRQLLKAPVESFNEGPVVEIEVRYGGAFGPDFEQICTKLGLSHDELIALHTGCDHHVEMMGFTPGFSYISGLPEGLDIPRLATPRSRVAAGSVGISSNFTGLYALDGPGGWPVIGQTDAVLFSPNRDDPFLLNPGHRVRFVAV